MMKPKGWVWIIVVLGGFIAVLMQSCSSGLEKADIGDRKLSNPLTINTTPRVLALGYGFSVGVKSDGTVWTWGNNHNGQLARPLGSWTEGYTPAMVPDLSDAVSVSAADCVLVLKKDGTVWSWGSNSHGQLGYRTKDRHSSVPTMIPGLTDVVDISTRAGTSLALRRDGTVWGWGWNTSGKVGFKEEGKVFTPRQINGLHHIAKIELGVAASFAIDGRGVLWSLGDKLWLGRTALEEGRYSYQPERVRLPLPVIEVTAQSDATYALLSDGSVWSWGSNHGGELATGESRNAIALSPRRIKSISGVVAIASTDGGAALTEGGEVVVWGVSAAGAPPGAPLPRHDLVVPHLLPFRASMPIRSFTGGLGVYALVDREGNAWFWKANEYGQRGTGQANSKPTREYWVTPEKSLWTFK